MLNRTVRATLPLWVAFAPLWLVFAVAPASAAMIDDFSVAFGGWPTSQRVVGSRSIQEFAGSPILGGVRGVAIAATSLNVLGADSVSEGVYPGAAIFDYASSVGADGTAGLRYDGRSGLGADLSSDASLSIDFLSFDLANGLAMPVTVTLEDSDAQVATLTRSLTVAGGQFLDFTFADFLNIGGVNLASIDAIDIGFDPGMATDFRLNGIMTQVPEPTSFGLFVFGLALCHTRRRVA